jgi:hypothetical protein
MKTPKNNPTMTALILVVATTLFSTGSSHREAPGITKSPKVDATDFYMFNIYEKGREDYVTIIANYVPLQDAYGGPNYFTIVCSRGMGEKPSPLCEDLQYACGCGLSEIVAQRL